MDKKQFLDDLQVVYNYLNDQKNSINKLYEYFEKKDFDKLELIKQFAKELDLALDDDLTMALITRLVNLRDDSLSLVLQKQNYSEDEIIILKENAYIFVKNYWLDIHKQTVNFIKEKNLLTPFYQTIFSEVYNVGIAMSSWQSSWTAKIINGINKELLEQFNNDNPKVIEFLRENNLFDKMDNNQEADRSYSMVVKAGDKLKSAAYIEAFKTEVTQVIDALENFVDALMEIEDKVYNQKWEYIQYLQSLITAFAEKRTNMLVSKWADVDRAWMKITTPIQIGHPLEYYEDHFRKAVALEWDIRVINPSLQNSNKRVEKIKSMFENIFTSFEQNQDYKRIYDFSLKSLDKVQLYLGRPALFFGAEFNGLFSAQVVPNDENVSREFGKKIFAFSDEILQSSRAKPFLKLQKEIFGQDFLTAQRNFLFKETSKWHHVYGITTIGHEFGHILWCDEETESVMNSSGNFKNIEEFKATTGGLVSFFLDNSTEQELERFVIDDTIKRAIGLIAWMEVDEVQPYYCEGLIHLFGLFQSNILSWDNDNKKLTINNSTSNITKLKQWYIDTYKKLALHYLNKKDGTIFLEDYAVKKDGNFTSQDDDIASFIAYYYKQYKLIGQELDTTDKRENYI